MYVGAVNVGAPGDDVFRVAEGLRLGTQFAANHRDERVAAGSGTNRAIQLRGAQTMEKSLVHGSVVQHPQRSTVGVRQNRLRTKLVACRGEAGVDLIKRLRPCDALKILRIARTRALGYAG